MRFAVESRLPDGSWLSTFRGRGRDRRRTCGRLPVRLLSYAVEGRDETYMLMTTLLDHRQAPAAELAALYHQRRELEHGLR